jgi:phosphoribosylglycinamide formyltransferase-1
MKRLAVLASGSGSNLQAIIDAIKNKDLTDVEIAIIVSNKKDAYALERARLNNIEDVFLNPKDFNSNEDFDKKIVEVLKTKEIDLIVLAGYLKILTDVFINAFENKIINIHPALLPHFGGKGMYGKKVHEAVLKNNEKESGCSVHYVTLGIDEGPIICQKKVPVLPNDTVDTLAARVLDEEHKLIVEGVKLALSCKVIACKDPTKYNISS